MQSISAETIVSGREVLEPLSNGVPENDALPPPEGGTTRNLWKIWRERRLLGKIALRALLVSTLVAFLIPNSFESVTRVLPSDSIPHTGGMLSALAGLSGSSSGGSSSSLLDIAGEALGTKNNGALYVALLHSRTVHENLVRRFNLMKVYHARYLEGARKTLEKNTEISEDRKSFVITLTVTDHDRERARGIAQGYIEELNNLLSHVTTSSAGQQRSFLEQRLLQVKKDLETAERNFSQYASKNATLDLPEQTRAMVESGAILEAQVIAAQSEVEGLQQIYTSNNVRVRTAQARLSELQRKLQQMGGAADGAPSGTSSAATPNSSGANDQQLYPPIRQLPLLGVEWADLYREVKVEETVFQLLTTQYELARMEEARETPVLNVVDPASLPERKSFPPRLVLILASTFVCATLGALWILALDRWHNISYDNPTKLLIQNVGQSAANYGRRLFERLPWERLKVLRTKRFHSE
jgi:capsule polysaccharide export protein KpsE/RkpR